MLRRILRLRGQQKNLQFIKPGARPESDEGEEQDPPTAADPDEASVPDEPSTAPDAAPPTATGAGPPATPLFPRAPRTGASPATRKPGAAQAPPAVDPGAHDDSTVRETAQQDALEDAVEPELGDPTLGALTEHLSGFSEQVAQFESAPEQQLLARAVHGLHRLEGVFGIASAEALEEDDREAQRTPDDRVGGSAAPQDAAADDAGDGTGESVATESEADLRTELERLRREQEQSERASERERAKNREENEALRARVLELETELDGQQLEKARLTAKQHRLLVKLKASGARVRSLESEALDQTEELQRLSEAFSAASAEFEELGRDLARRESERARTIDRLRALSVAVRATLPGGKASTEAGLEGALADCQSGLRRLLAAHAWREAEMRAVGELLGSSFWRVGSGLPRRVAGWTTPPADAPEDGGS